MDHYINVLKKFADFKGRARRKEFWIFTIISAVIDIALGLIEEMAFEESNGYFKGVFSLIILVPSISVSIRRMHDVGKSGWFNLIPIYNIYLAIKNGDEGPNAYGEDPKSFS